RRAMRSRRRSRVNIHLGDRHDEACAPAAHVSQLLDDLVFNVPRQDQNEVRFGLVYGLRRQNRDMSTRSELAVLVRVTVDGIVDEIRADTAVVEQRVAFARRSVADNRFARAFGLDEKVQQATLGPFYVIGKVVVIFDSPEPSFIFPGAQLAGPSADRFAAMRMTSVNS